MPTAKPLLLISTLALTAFAGCSDDTTSPPDPPDDGLLAAPPTGQGVQYALDTTIDAGSEVERCRFVQAPADGLWVKRDEVRYTEGSHHFLLYETAYDDIPESKNDGTPVDTSGVFDCSDGPTNGWSVTRLVGGSQNANGDSALSFPDGVALRVRPGAVLMLNAHYINTRPEPLDAEVRINLWTLPEEDVVTEGDILFWYNIFIDVPAMGASQAKMRCTIPSDITVTSMQSHMHARGVGYVAQEVGADMPFYLNDRWEDVPVSRFDQGFPLKAGAEVEYACNYENGEPRDVHQGPRSTDEMCMLIGSYYPAVPGLSFCAADPEAPLATQGLGARWIGDGEATCAETLACVQAGAESDDFFDHLQGCVVKSDPAVSREMSDAVRCLLLALGSGQEPVEACGSEIGSCLAL
ncbi:MAG: hypothetical protein R3B72_45335 [Polyangiaceae bacterium]